MTVDLSNTLAGAETSGLQLPPHLRVLHLSAGNLYGGVETILTTLARSAYSSSGMEPEFGLCFRARLWNELVGAGVPVHDLGPVRFSRPWTVIRARRRLSRLLERGAYDVVVCHMSWTQAIFGETAARRGPGFVAYFHGKPLGNWLDRLAYRLRPRLIIGPSQFTLRDYQAVYSGTRSAVVYSPLPVHFAESPELSPDERSSTRRQLGASNEDVVFLQASRIDAAKGTDLTLRAFGCLRDIPGWALWLAGGPQRPGERRLFASLISLAGDLGISDRVQFLGERSDVATLMRASDVYCQGNRDPEALGMTFLEAGFCRLPIVTSDLGGAREVVDPRTGILVKPSDDVSDLSEALHTMLRDPHLRSEMGRRGREKVLGLCDARQQIGLLARLLASTRG